MSLPIYLNSAMQGAPALAGSTNGAINSVLNACLVNGFNTQSVVSATASGGVVTFNFASGPGFSALDTVTVAGATNTTVNGQRRVQSSSGNQVLIAIPGVPDGAVGGTITLKFSPLGWTRPYSGTNVSAYRQGGSASHKRFLRVFDNTITSANQWFARGYGAMTAVSTGTDPFPNLTDYSGNGPGFSSSNVVGNIPWWIVGTPRAFYFYYQISSLTPNQNDLTSFVFVELDRINKPGDTYAQVMGSQSGFGNGATFICRSYSGVANTAKQVQIYGPGASGVLSGGLTYPDPAGGNLVFVDAPWLREQSGSDYALRGYLPGMLCALQNTTPLQILNSIPGVTGRVATFWDTYGSSYTYGLRLDEDWGDL